jgi:hypothetical protein
MGGGISKFDLRSPAPMPKRKKRMAGSKKLFSKSYSITQLLMAVKTTVLRMPVV